MGQPFGVQRSHMRKLRRDVARALSAELGARADHVPVTTLRGRNTPPRPGAARPYLGPFLRAYLGDQPPGTLRELYKLEGWHDRGRTYLHRSYAAFTRTLRLHETLHALSRPFTAECRARGERSLGRGYTRLFEAITDYFAGHVAERRFGVVPDRSDGRYGSVSFGRRLADVVGHDRLRRIYLGQGAGLLDNLARAVGSEAFRRAVAHLDRGDFDAARSAASGW